ncbi:MAG: Wzz/FepE/Etk N-terminal domain-containing protein [Candidatus Omnitrophota bacterium]|jgi:uncharacterized protein involved in exopolysaccharide biosynthesis
MKNQEHIQNGLVEYANIIIKRKKLILAIFFITVFISATTSFFLPKAYKATVSMMVEEEQPAGKQAASQPSINFAENRALLKSNLILAKIIQDLHLKDPSGKALTEEALSKKLKVATLAKTNLIELTVTHAKPQEAKEIANAWANDYVEYDQELISGEVKRAQDLVADQFKIASENLFKAEEKLNDFNKKYKLDLMNAELDIKKTALNSYKNELVGIMLGLKTKEDLLCELKKQVAMQEKFTIISKAITDDALWQAFSKEKNSSEINNSSLKSEVVNPIYQDLETRIVNTNIEINTLKPRIEYLNKSIEAITGESADLENDIIQEKFELTQLTREIDIYKKAYSIFSNKIEETRFLKTNQFERMRIVSPAITPNDPTGPGVIRMAAAAGILSLMLGVFLACLMESWSKMNKERVK